ncbi:MAG: site-specific integrase [Planctomycetes bacterium]|nr:site-specific integrase [Planctomycetota bacterium]
MTQAKKRTRMTLSQFFRHVYCKRRAIVPVTIVGYKTAINSFQHWHGKPVLLSRITADLLRGFLTDYRQGSAATTVNGKRRILLVLWRYAHRWGFAGPPPGNWEIPKLPEPKRTPTAWTVEEFGRLLAACVVARPLDVNGTVWDSRHWRALLLTIYDTGERLGALLLTARRDLSSTGHLTIRGEHRKGKTRDIVRKLHPQTMESIEALPPHRLLFPWPFCKRVIWRHFEPILEAAGLPVDRRSKFHCCRRTSATHLAAVSGAERAQRHLDHSSVALTVANYIDPRMLPNEAAVEVLPRPTIDVDLPDKKNDEDHPATPFRIVG